MLLLVACSGQELASTTAGTVAISPTTAVATTRAAPSTTGPTTTTAPLAPLQGLTYTEIATGLDRPTDLRATDSGLYFSTADGVVWQLGDAPQLVLDISDRVTTASNEQGLLSFAFHPDDPDRLFAHYSDPSGNTTVSEFVAFDASSERVLLQVEQPFANHNGGTIAFGPEGLLWVALGDGGGGGDPLDTGQFAGDLLGNILRLDVDAAEPQPEVWSIGLRNPWRLQIDEGLVYIGDVGQNAYEEINVAAADAPDLNYGWNITEGLHCFEPASGCDTAGLTPPVLEVPHGEAGTCSIAGGVVYRGAAIPELLGHYFYSDYCGGWLRSFRFADGQALDEQNWTDAVGVPGNVISFGTDTVGEIYVLTEERILRLDPVR